VDDERLIGEGLAGRLSPDSMEFERFVDLTAGAVNLRARE
jgi:hypothetical protein